MKGREWYQEDDIADEYEDKRFTGGGELIDEGEKRALFELLGDIEGKSVLEIACGTGRFTVELAEKGADVVGMDISRPMIERAIRKAESRGVRDEIQFFRGDAKRLPFPDDSFDIVLAMRFFHLADEPLDFLREMRRVSRSVVFFDTFNDGSARVLYNRFLPMGSRLYSADQVHQLLENSELELADSKDDFVFPFGLYRSIPTVVAQGIRGVDDTLKNSVASNFCSVSYWKAEKPE